MFKYLKSVSYGFSIDATSVHLFVRFYRWHIYANSKRVKKCKSQFCNCSHLSCPCCKEAADRAFHAHMPISCTTAQQIYTDQSQIRFLNTDRGGNYMKIYGFQRRKKGLKYCMLNAAGNIFPKFPQGSSLRGFVLIRSKLII